MTEARWDRPMSKGEKRRLSPADKHLRDVTSLLRKVAVIERAASGGAASERADLPTDRAKLRRWESVDERLWPWSDPQVDNPSGSNAALIARFDAAIERLRKARRRGRAGLREDLEHASRRIAVLDQQVADLIGQNRQLRVELSRHLRR